MLSLIFISSALQQPRHQKRIDLLSKEYDLKVLYFFRDKYTDNYKNYIDNAIRIGEVKDGKYFSRVYLLLKLFFILIGSSVKNVYCTSPDQVLIALLARKKVFFEVGDLYQIDGRNKIYQILDKFILPRISGLILTSQYFYSGYFKKFHNFLKNKVLIVENKLVTNCEAFVSDYRNNFYKKKQDKIFKFGLIGSLAFKKSLLKIREFIINNPQYELHIYGDGLINIFHDIPNCFYHGHFKSPEDLPSIYNNIDINIILYDYDNNNVKLALPNKLYESIAFLKPIICASGVALSEYVVSNHIGVIVEGNDLEASARKIINEYEFYIKSLAKMPSSSYLCYEQEQILELLKSNRW
ncbi:Glycosyl transferases group 1 [Acinetobacter baumannii]|uniref:glycosyltransferase n=1 Tax=Acinetobacter baumannii TaxID=470 RepID=UPI000DE7A12D|nr:glycosyltransferase [Acinetobacter baumannii]SSP00514.1 Glycosyl transferases group 1 [Acinetobacter baumannii]